MIFACAGGDCVNLRSERRKGRLIRPALLICAAVVSCIRYVHADDSSGATTTAAGISSTEVTAESTVSGQEIVASYLLIRPADVKGPLPVALVFTAIPAPSQNWKIKQSPDTKAHAIDLALRGYLAVSIGHANYRSAVYTADLNRCSREKLDDLFQRNADYVQAVIDTLANDPQADLHNIIIVANGAASLDSFALAARRVPGLKAVINIGGGVSPPNCSPSELVETLLSTYSARGDTPSLWLYAKNDPYLTEDIVTKQSLAYSKGGRHPVLKFIPMGAEDPIMLFTSTSGRSALLGEMDGFLNEIGLPNIDDKSIGPIAHKLSRDIPRSILESYLKAPANKALAMSRSGNAIATDINAFGLSDAASAALSSCRSKAMAMGADCHLVMLNNQPQ